MDERIVYLRTKRLTLMAISVSQFILGTICVILWTAGIEFCQNCYNPDKWNVGCNWTSTLQGVWGGGAVLLCGIMSFLQSCKPSSSRNPKYIIVTVATLVASTGLIVFEVLLINNVLKMNQNIFIEHCFLKSTSMLWNYFHYTFIGIGGLCFILGVFSCIISSYAQCGCCGIYCDTEADREYNRTYSYSHNSQERLLPTQTTDGTVCVHSCVHHSCNVVPPAYQQQDPAHSQFQRAEPTPRIVPEVDDLLRIEDDHTENLIQLDGNPNLFMNANSSESQGLNQEEDAQHLESSPPKY